jgi:peptidylprolyl isomerase
MNSRTVPALALAFLAAPLLSACSAGPRGAAEPRALGDEIAPFASLLPWNPNRRDVQSTPDGVQYVAIRRGDPGGRHPGPGDRVEVRYDARLAATGKSVDQTTPGQTAVFRLSDVVPGLSAGIQKMVPGDEFMFFVPAHLAYGARAIGPVPANADLVFLTTLSGIPGARTADAAAWARIRPWPADAIHTASGLQYIVLETGQGASPGPRDVAVLDYEGRLDDGKVFDSSFAAGRPAYFPVSEVIPGFSEALKLMRPGDRWMIRIPADLAYGKVGADGIPPGAALTFEVELESVIKAVG